MSLYTASFPACRQGQSHLTERGNTASAVGRQWFIRRLDTWAGTISVPSMHGHHQIFLLYKVKGLSCLKTVSNALGVILTFDLLINYHILRAKYQIYHISMDILH